MSEFRLRIELGNEAMQTAEDVAEALRRTAKRLEMIGQQGPILDTNGNLVGGFEFHETDSID